MKRKRTQYVYILENPSMPGIIKIGMTKRTPKIRANELSSHTGVPLPFKVSYSRKVDDAFKIEDLVHSKLSRYRLNPRREFFRIPKDKAIKCIESTTLRDQRRLLNFILILLFLIISLFFVRQMFSFDVSEMLSFLLSIPGNLF